MTMDEFGLVGQRVEERYDIERVVAAGGFGTVYFGRHRALRTAVAIKVLRIPKDLTEAERRDFAQRFLAEAQTLAQLQHPAVVRASDFGVSPMPNGQTAPWMALEWVDGPTLKEVLDARRGEPMSAGEALALLRPVLEALATAHAEGIAHRDIKPANIMLPRAAGALPSRVLDFGIAKAMRPEETAEGSGETRTKSSMSAFSLKYAAPEQVGGLRTGPWSDVHALGLVLTEMLTGKEAYAGNDSMDLTVAVISPRRPTPAAFGVDVGPWEAVLARAVAFKPADRFRHAGELLAALEAGLSARPPAVANHARTPTMPGPGGAFPAGPVAPAPHAPVQDSLASYTREADTTVAPRRSRAGKVVAAVAVVGLALAAGTVAVLSSSDPPPQARGAVAPAPPPVPPAPRVAPSAPAVIARPAPQPAQAVAQPAPPPRSLTPRPRPPTTACRAPERAADQNVTPPDPTSPPDAAGATPIGIARSASR